MKFFYETKLFTFKIFVNWSVSRAYIQQKKLDNEIKVLQTSCAQLSKLSTSWLRTIDEFNTALKALLSLWTLFIAYEYIVEVVCAQNLDQYLSCDVLIGIGRRRELDALHRARPARSVRRSVHRSHYSHTNWTHATYAARSGARARAAHHVALVSSRRLARRAHQDSRLCSWRAALCDPRDLLCFLAAQLLNSNSIFRICNARLRPSFFVQTYRN